ncbi:hypothetical protein TNCV_3602161, partial [Trichonephila clavipes]
MIITPSSQSAMQSVAHGNLVLQ